MPNQIISQEGYDKLKKEFDYLTNVKRPDIIKRIAHAKEMGDLSENAEYTEAKDAQGFNEGRISEISRMLKTLTVVKTNKGNGFIAMGSKITVKSINGTKQFTIVSFNEADPANGKISNESPLGEAFLDKKPGDTVEVETPKGKIQYEVIEIE